MKDIHYDLCFDNVGDFLFKIISHSLFSRAYSIMSGN